jgi:hypothetical protein
MSEITWPIPWRLVDARRAEYIARELRWELSHLPDHPLANVTFRVVAMKDEYDSAIVELEDGTFAYVRLTWKQALPHFERVGGEAELGRFFAGRAANDSHR